MYGHPVGVWTTRSFQRQLDVEVSVLSRSIILRPSFTNTTSHYELILQVDFGKYTSYECTGKGTYRAIVKSKVITADGKEETSTTCEIGKVDLAAGTYKFAASANKCPTEYTDKSIRAGP